VAILADLPVDLAVPLVVPVADLPVDLAVPLVALLPGLPGQVDALLFS
jgi:hypothetical protein